MRRYKMGFFDDFGKKISSAGQEAIAKTKELADVAKINSSISDEENKIKVYLPFHRSLLIEVKLSIYRFNRIKLCNIINLC